MKTETDVNTEDASKQNTLLARSTTFSRADYMEKRCTHRQYYAQWVTPAIKRRVATCFTVERLVKSNDPHLNDILLWQWDRLAGCREEGSEIIGTPTPKGDDNSLSTAICILKEAAKQIIDSATEVQS